VAFAAVTTAYRDVRVRISYAASTPAVVTCSTDSFSIRPVAFTISSAGAGVAATNNTLAASPIFKAGGDNFNLTATAVAGYDSVPQIDNAKIIGTNTAGAISGNFGTAASGTGIAVGNTFKYSEVGVFGLSADAVTDSTFTIVDPAGSDCVLNSTSVLLSGGKYGCVIGSNAVAVASGFGRFIPAHFSVSNAQLTNRVGRSCDPVSNFTYMGEPMQAQFTLTAQNAAGNPTVNYADSYARLNLNAASIYDLRAFDSFSSSTARAISAITKANPGVVTTASAHGFSSGDSVYIDDVKGMFNVNAGVYEIIVISPTSFSIADTSSFGTYTSGGTARNISSSGVDRSSGRLNVTAPSGLSWVSGVATVPLQFNFGRNASGTADGPFAMQFGIAPVDSDGVKVAPYDMDVDSPFGSSDRDHAKLGASSVRYGRARMANAHGSEVLRLNVPLTIEFFNGSAFAANTADTCTTFSASNFAFEYSPTTPRLEACETALLPARLTGPSPRFNLSLNAPGIGNDGLVDVTLNLGSSATGNQCTAIAAGTGAAATTSGYTWLQYNWRGAVGNPKARATFGKYRSGPVIHRQEVY
jgi:hypothetical protein